SRQTRRARRWPVQATDRRRGATPRNEIRGAGRQLDPSDAAIRDGQPVAQRRYASGNDAHRARGDADRCGQRRRVELELGRTQDPENGSDFIAKHPVLVVLLPDEWRARFEQALAQGYRADIGYNNSGFYVRGWKSGKGTTRPRTKPGTTSSDNPTTGERH